MCSMPACQTCHALDAPTEMKQQQVGHMLPTTHSLLSCHLSTCFVTRALMRKLAPVELLLKATEVGDPQGAPSVLSGAVVRLLVDKVRGRAPVGVKGKAAVSTACSCSVLASYISWPVQECCPPLHPLAPLPLQAYKLRLVQGTFVKPETGRLMLVLHVRRASGGQAAGLALNAEHGRAQLGYGLSALACSPAEPHYPQCCPCGPSPTVCLRRTSPPPSLPTTSPTRAHSPLVTAN